MEPSKSQQILSVISTEWWVDDSSSGRALIDSIRSLYPWDNMVNDSLNAALILLAEMAELSVPEASYLVTNAVEKGLFEIE